MSTPEGVVKGGRIRAVDGVRVEPGAASGQGLGGFTGADNDNALAGADGARSSQAHGLLEQSRSRSHALLSAAQQEALDIVAQAEASAADVSARAQQEINARRMGLEKELRGELENEYKQRFAAAASALEGAAKELRRRETEFLESIEQPALSLVLAIARQLIRAEWEQDRGALARMVGTALRQLQPDDSAVLALAPETLARVNEGAGLDAAFSENGVRIGQIRLEADPALSAGQFTLRAANVSVGFDLDNAMAEMSSHLRLASSGQLGGVPLAEDSGVPALRNGVAAEEQE